MDQKTLSKFKSKLEAERQRITSKARAAMDELAEKTQERVGDEGDEAAAISETHLALRFRDRDRQLLDKVELALERIKLGEFGICQDCGEDIGLKRLEIRPVAELCVGCKEIEEKKEGAFSCD